MISVERGLKVATPYACIACHSLDVTIEGKVDQTLKLASTKRVGRSRMPQVDGLIQIICGIRFWNRLRTPWKVMAESGGHPHAILSRGAVPE